MISILIPLYNGVEYLNEAVTSVFLQTFENWELMENGKKLFKIPGADQ